MTKLDNFEAEQRAIFKRIFEGKLDLNEKVDMWGRAQFLESHVDAIWYGWFKHAEMTESPILTLGEEANLIQAVQDFEDANETVVEYATLMLLANKGYLECVYFNQTEEAQRIADANPRY